MSPRLKNPKIKRVGRSIILKFNGKAIPAIEGETVAAALTASGIMKLRHTRSGAPRGLWCGMGACFECVVTIDGRPEQRACLAKAVDGMEILSGVPANPAPLASPPSGQPIERCVDVLVVGAGPAGLNAALVASRSGLTVTLLDERPNPGGQYFKPLGPSYAHQSAGADKQFQAGSRLESVARDAGVEILSEAVVWGAFSVNEISAYVAGQAILFRARQVVVAAGAFERPVPVPGWTLPGVMTTGSAQTLARSYRVAPGLRTIVAGNGPLNLQTAVELIEGGAEVAAVVEAAARPGVGQIRDVIRLVASAPDLAWDGVSMLRRLRSAGVPVFWGRRVVEITPNVDGAFGAVKLDDGKVIAGDALAMGYGFIPSSELARQLGVSHRFIDQHVGYLSALTDDAGRCNVPGVHVIGDCAEIGGARIAASRGVLAGAAVVEALGGQAPSDEVAKAQTSLALARRFQQALWSIYRQPTFDSAAIPDDVVVCRCEEVSAASIRACLAIGEPSLGSIKRRTRAGMGRCQGRNCAVTLARFAQSVTGRLPGEFDLFAPRVPAKPIPLVSLAFEQAEWGGHKEVEAPLPVADRTQASRLRDRTDLSTDVLVVGGGILGSSCALALSRLGIETMVLERDEPNLQASGANAGSLHVQLLSFDFGEKAQAGGGPAAKTLVLGPSAIELWQAIGRESGIDLEIRTTGGLMVAETERDMAFLKAKVELERSYGVECDVIGRRELRELSPALSEQLIGAAYCPLEGKINPAVATYAVVDLAKARGVRFQNGTDVQDIEKLDKGFRVKTNRGDVRCHRVVNAAGPWSPRIGRMVGVAVPVKGAPLQIVVTTPGPKLVTQLVAHADRHLTLKQADTGGFIIGGGWTAASEPSTGLPRVMRSSLEGNLWVARRVVPALDGYNILRGWAAMNVNLDGAPLVGEVPGVPGFFNAVTSNGYTLGPIVGQLTASLVAGHKPDFDVTPFSIERFS